MLNTIRQKVVVAAVSVLAICGATAGCGLWVADTLSGALDRSAASAALLRNHMSADMMHDALRSDVLSVLASGDPAMNVSLDEARGELAEHQTLFRRSIAESEKLAEAPALREALKSLKGPLDAYIESAGEIADLQGRDPTAAKARLADFKARFDVLEGAMEKASDRIEAVAEADALAAERQSRLGRVLMEGAIGIGVLFGVALVILALKTVVGPVKTLAVDMRRLAGGELDLKLAGADRRDEVGEIGRAVRDFQDLIVEKARAEAAEADRRRQAELDAEAAKRAERLARERDLGLVVDSLAAGLRRLAAGDVSFQVEEVFSPEYERLRQDFNAAVSELRETLGSIHVAAEAIRTGSGEIGEAAGNLSRRTEQQAASLEETAAALDQITATVRTSAEGAERARSVVSATKDEAERSGVVVRDAVDAMSEIEKSSSQIAQIIGVIDEIAFQTNLLALNAGVEAARAGDAGKGFAVVASEVRALAQRSAEAAREIRDLISSSTAQVSEGVALVGRTGEALDRIQRQVVEINELIGAISASANEQSAGLAQVNTAVNQMDQMTQQNAAMVEESTAATSMLNQQVHHLFAMVGRFQVGTSGGFARAA